MRNLFTKKVILSVVIVLGILVVLRSKSNAQSYKITSYVEKTNVSPKVGASFGYRFGCHFEAGGFFQQELLPGFSEELPDRREKEFYGVYFGIPVVCRESYSLDFQVRSGMVNTVNFIITPSLQFTYRPVSFIGISAGLGVRNLSPTFIPKIDIAF